MNEQMVRVLCRYIDAENGDELYYAGGWQNGAKRVRGDDIIGICITPKGRRPQMENDFGLFERNVKEAATEVRWFDEPLTVGGADG